MQKLQDVSKWLVQAEKQISETQVLRPISYLTVFLIAKHLYSCLQT